jgi:hypothetical protein
MVVAHDPIQTAVDQLAARLRRSVVINDPGVHLLYASAHYGDEDPVRIRAVLQREADAKVIGHVQGVATWTSAGVIPPNPGLEMHARVCLPVRWRGELIGLLMVMDADGSLTTRELAVITAVAEEVAPLLAPQSSAGPDPAEQAVLDLVGDDLPLRSKALAELPAVRGVTAIELGATGGAAAGHVETALRTALSGRLHAVRDGVAMVLVQEDPRGYADRLLHRVRDLSAGRFGCTAGIGTAVPGLQHAFESAAQARLARRAAATVLATPVATWAELGPWSILLRIPPGELTAAALPDEVRRLRGADPGGLLTRTVRAYLDHAGNGPAAAASLHIHRTTLYYRLRQVRELTGLDLDDGRIRLALHLGLTLAGTIT